MLSAELIVTIRQNANQLLALGQDSMANFANVNPGRFPQASR